MRTLMLVLLLAAFAAAVAGCGGQTGGEAGGEEPASSTPLPYPEPAVGEVLSRFVEAAGAGDAEGMWTLLSLPTQKRLAPVALSRIEPEGTSTSAAPPRIVLVIEPETAIEEASLWLDGKPLPADAGGTDGRQIRLEAFPGTELAPGRQSIVVFGRTSTFAAAGSTPLTVTEASSD